jgi:DNA-binding transcriptional ArsR family regulator
VITNGAAGALTALGDPTRRTIFELVAEQPRPVAAIADLVPVTRPAVSQHLKVLQRAGLVRAEPHGTRRIYEVDPSGVEAVREYFDRYWWHSLANFKQAVEQHSKEEQGT